MKPKIIFLVLIIGFVSCVNSTDETGNTLSGSIDNDALIMATLYNHYAAEYKALSHQAFNIASERIKKIADDETIISSLAIIVDIDETILDNSPYQAKLINDKIGYPEYWNEWCNLSKAEPVPGALRFLSYADSLGFTIFYISNRKKRFVEDGTIANLREIGFPQVEEGKILLREDPSDLNPDPSNKESRRTLIENQGYRIVLLAGDNLGDFFEDSRNTEGRNLIVESVKSEFGKKFIVLPNAMYGNWPASLNIGIDNSTIEQLIKNMSDLVDDHDNSK